MLTFIQNSRKIVLQPHNRNFSPLFNGIRHYKLFSTGFDFDDDFGQIQKVKKYDSRFNSSGDNFSSRDYPNKKFNNFSSYDNESSNSDYISPDRKPRNFSSSSSPFNGRNKTNLNDGRYSRLRHHKIQWSEETLIPFRKNFYQEHPNVSKLSMKEVEAIRKSSDISIKGKDVPKPFVKFSESNLPQPILDQLNRTNLIEPTPIQSQGIPMALSGRDFVGISRTGSGKTLAYVIPAIIHIQAQPVVQRGEGPIGLILAPTRELVIQINEEIDKFVQSNSSQALIKHCAVYGGADRHRQIRNLQQSPDILVATPGRLIDLLSENYTNFKRTTYLVLDEADRMLDMGFQKDLECILSFVRPDKQTLCWSATWPNEIDAICSTHLSKDYIKCTIGSTDLHANGNIKQQFKLVNHHDKLNQLINDLDNLVLKQNKKILLFTNTKRSCDRLEHQIKSRLRINNIAAIHGDKSQQERDRIMYQYRHNEIKILIATDVCARGIDIRDINAVIVYDFHPDVEVYVHRIGRTGRGNDSGLSLCYLTQDDLYIKGLTSKLKQVVQKSNQPVPDFLNKMGGF